MPKTTDREDIDRLAIEIAKLLSMIDQLKVTIIVLSARTAALELTNKIVYGAG